MSPMPDPHPGYWLFLIDWLIRLAALVWIPARSPPAAARSWLLLVGFVPLLGLPLYLVLGHPWLARERRVRQARASQVIRKHQSGRALLRWSPGESDETAGDIAQLTERVGDFMPLGGNAIELLDRYEASIEALLRDIESARQEVHLLYYLMHDDEVGRAVAEALRRAATRGVRCRVLLDAVGAKPGLRAWARPLRAAGVEVRAMLAGGLCMARALAHGPAQSPQAGGDRRTDRLHRLAEPRRSCVRARSSEPRAGRARAGAGGAAACGVVCQRLADRATAKCSTWPTAKPALGASAAQVLPSGPGNPFQNARDVVIALVQRARHRVVLVTPYFVPDDATLSTLRIAALAGVDVLLVLQASSNKPLTHWAQQAYYEELLRSGVRIALYRPRFLHAKHLSVDDDIALVGSISTSTSGPSPSMPRLACCATTRRWYRVCGRSRPATSTTPSSSIWSSGAAVRAGIAAGRALPGWPTR